jgi:hypothetical protein
VEPADAGSAPRVSVEPAFAGSGPGATVSFTLSEASLALRVLSLPCRALAIRTAGPARRVHDGIAATTVARGQA